MFWKKKTPPFSIVNPGETAEKRQSFRYTFKKEQGISMNFRGRQIILLDLSAGGMSFKNNGFSVGARDMVFLDLEIPDIGFHRDVSVPLKINRIDEQGICYACFEESDPANTELIHRYLLEMQKLDLRGS